MISQKDIKETFNGLVINETVFLCDDYFSKEEVQIYTSQDRANIWEPDGEPFCGEFDIYIKIIHKTVFKGFFRIELFSWGEIHLHIAFPTSKSLISRYYLGTTELFLKKLIPFAKMIPIYCVFRSSNKNVLDYMKYFQFEKEKSLDGLDYYKFNL
jgi:hypothetical protein